MKSCSLTSVVYLEMSSHGTSRVIRFFSSVGLGAGPAGNAWTRLCPMAKRTVAVERRFKEHMLNTAEECIAMIGVKGFVKVGRIHRTSDGVWYFVRCKSVVASSTGASEEPHPPPKFSGKCRFRVFATLDLNVSFLE